MYGRVRPLGSEGRWVCWKGRHFYVRTFCVCLSADKLHPCITPPPLPLWKWGPFYFCLSAPPHEKSFPGAWAAYLGGICSFHQAFLSMFCTDKFALSQSDARISVAYFLTVGQFQANVNQMAKISNLHLNFDFILIL